ncbi:MAG TPA: lipopolysaccharide assembly protein LapA domain-containing protein [Mycobacterium sp.]
MSTDPTVPPPPDVPPVALEPDSRTGYTRAAAMWTALILGFFILIVLLIFIAQNTTTTPFQFLGWHWSLPLGVAILFAAVAGGLITVAVGAVRMFQLRRAAKHNLTVGH